MKILISFLYFPHNFGIGPTPNIDPNIKRSQIGASIGLSIFFGKRPGASEENSKKNKVGVKVTPVGISRVNFSLLKNLIFSTQYRHLRFYKNTD